LRDGKSGEDKGAPAAPSSGPSPRLEMRTTAQAGGPAPAARAAEPATRPRAIARFEELIALAEEKRDLPTRTALERDVRLVRFEDGKLEIALESGAPK